MHYSQTTGPALLEALVDPNEPLLPPKRMPKYLENLEKALNRGTPGAEEIRAALAREPAHTQLDSRILEVDQGEELAP